MEGPFSPQGVKLAVLFGHGNRGEMEGILRDENMMNNLGFLS